MRKYSLPHCFSSAVILMAVLAFCAPFIAYAQQAELDEARVDAERDAQNEVNGTLWFFIGCFTPLWAYIFEAPPPPASRLLGKSPEYTSIYMDTYKAKGKSIQTSKSWTGFLVGVGIYVGLVILAVAAAAESDSDGDEFEEFFFE